MKIRISSFLIFLSALAILTMSCSKKDHPPDPVTDIEGNTYKTVRIGDQIWMAENLRTSAFSDGTEIPVVGNADNWNKLTSAGRCWYNNDEAANKDTYGSLYNYFSVSSGSLCPDGWHVPSKDEWQKLREVIGDSITAGGKLKEEGILHWNAPNTGAVNSYGFTALPAGIRYYEGTFDTDSFFTAFWSSTESDNENGWYLSLNYIDALASMKRIHKNYGFSIRCIKN